MHGGVCYFNAGFSVLMKNRIIIVLIALISLGLAQGAISTNNTLSLDDYLYAKRLYDEGYFDLAAEQLQRVLQNYPEFPNADEAHYLLADSYYKNEEYKNARATYLRLAIVFPESPLAAESMYKVARVLEVMQNPKEAAHAYSRVQGFYPQSVFALKGLGDALRLYETAEDTAKAESVSDLILEKYPTSSIADKVRLQKAMWFLARKDVAKAKSLLIRLSAQTSIDSLSAEALLELGRIYRSELAWEKAKNTWSKAVSKAPHSNSSFRAMIEIADLYIYQGLTSEAIAMLTLAEKNYTDVLKVAQSKTKIGDAYYRQEDYSSAHNFYHMVAGDRHEAKLKSAWTAELLGDSHNALQEYLEIVDIASGSSFNVKLHIAKLAQKTDQAELAKQYWSLVVTDTTLADSLGRLYWEYSKLLGNNLNDLNLLDSLSNLLKVKYPNSPFADDITYTTAVAYDKNKQYEKAIIRYQELIDNFPASEYTEPSVNSINYIQNTKNRSPRLVDKMAELSSSSQSLTNPVKWATAWGDFYLDDFNNPIKAIDHYDEGIQDVLGSTEQRSYCLYKSGLAYLNLCQAAMMENDVVSVEMYCDSARSRLIDLEKLAAGSHEVVSLSNEILYLIYTLAGKDSSKLRISYERTNETIELLGIDNIRPLVFAKFFQTALILEAIDSSSYDEWIYNSLTIEDRSSSDTEIAEIRFIQLILISDFQSKEAAIDSANLILSRWQTTPAAVSTLEWLIQNTKVTATQKLEYLQLLKASYPYRMDYEIYAWQSANAFDSLGMHFESLIWNQRQKELSEWGNSGLDILDIPDANTHYRRGTAYLISENFVQCNYEYQSYLNLDPMGGHAADVILSFAKINMYSDNHRTTIAYLDTLIERFPYSSQAEIGEIIRPRLEFSAGNYSQAFDLYQALSSVQSNPDSSFEYEKLSIVCKYRLNELTTARLMAKDFYKKFDKRNDIDSFKSLFYLEKGRSLQSSGNFVDARKNYKIVANKYSLSEWMDDAQFETAMSYMKERNWKDGTDHLTRFIENYPQSEYIPQGVLTLGVTLLNEESYSEALKFLKSAWSNSTSEHIRLRAFNHLITAYKDLRFWDAAIHISRDYLNEYPDATDFFDRKMDIGQFYMQIGEYEEAVRHYRPMLDYADAESEAEIQFYIGESFQNAGDYQTAILEYMKVRILGRKTKLDWGITALYQSGNCYELLGDNEGAARVYRRIIKDTGATSNYGRTALKRMNELKVGDEDR